MTSKTDRMDEAKELYSQAANCFKLVNNWKRAIEAFEKCIECEEND